MKLIVIILLFFLPYINHSQPLITLPTSHPVISIPIANFDDYNKDKILKNLDDLPNSNNIFITQFINVFNNSGSDGLVYRRYYKVTTTKMNGMVDGEFQIKYLYQSKSPFFGHKEIDPEVEVSRSSVTIISGNYKDGEKAGIWTFYNLRGELIAQGELKGDRQVGQWLEKRREHFINGYNKEASKSYYWESNYTQKGLRNGVSVGYLTQAKQGRTIEINYQNGLKNGTEIKYYSGEKVHFKGEYRLGKRTNLYQVWAEDGTKILETSFKNDLYHGQFTKWTATGKLQYFGQYIDGLREGEWITNDVKGNNLISKGKYEKGKKNGIWIVNFPDQKLYRKEFFKEGRWYEILTYTDSGCLYRKSTKNSNNRTTNEEFECQ